MELPGEVYSFVARKLVLTLHFIVKNSCQYVNIFSPPFSPYCRHQIWFVTILVDLTLSHLSRQQTQAFAGFSFCMVIFFGHYVINTILHSWRVCPRTVPYVFTMCFCIVFDYLSSSSLFGHFTLHAFFLHVVQCSREALCDFCVWK